MMPDRFEKFTTYARSALVLGQEEARQLKHHYLGTEHQLIGLLREDKGVAALVLHNLGVQLDTVRADVIEIIGYGDTVEASAMLPVTPRAKRVIELAEDEARQLHHLYVGTEHLLLGLMREGEGIGAGILARHGINLAQVRAEVTRTLQQPGLNID